MYDHSVEDVEEGKLVGVMMIDLSAAFDMVDHQIHLEKLQHFGFEESVLAWINSYLFGRSQSVMVDGCLSPPLNIVCGVPRTSILRPLLYILFTNYIPELVHEHPVDYASPHTFCMQYVGTTCYVDDATYSFGHTDPAVSSSKLSDQYQKIAKYMAGNKLVINADTNHLVVMGGKQFYGRRNYVRLTAGEHLVLPSSTEKLLGGSIKDDLKWKEHILNSKQSLVTQLTNRINGLCLISPRATFHNRLMVANGIFMSKICT